MSVRIVERKPGIFQSTQKDFTIPKVLLVVPLLFCVISVCSRVDYQLQPYTSVLYQSVGLGIACLFMIKCLSSCSRKKNGYTFGERVFRTAVLQEAVADGILERRLIKTYRTLSCHKGDFDPVRATSAEFSMGRIGAQFLQIYRSPHERLETMFLDSISLEKQICKLGGSWERIGNKFVIKAPSERTDAWRRFKADIAKFKWDETSEGDIVTCHDADVIPKTKEYLFLFLLTSSLPISMNLRRLGFYVGCKQNAMVVNPSGAGNSTGIASEGQHYADMEIIYDWVKRKFAPYNIWIMGSCGAAPMAAYLKKQHHHEGINLIIESTFTDLKNDFVKPQGRLVTKIAECFWGGISSKNPNLKQLETNYNIPRILQGLRFSLEGQFIVINVTNDQRLAREVGKKLVKVAASVNAKVLEVWFKGLNKNPHSSRYFLDSIARRKVISFIFSEHY